MSSSFVEAPSAEFPGLPQTASAGAARKLRVCIASFDFVGPVRNGGVGTAFTSLGEVLAEAGHEVTLLYLSGQFSEGGSLKDWIDYYRARKIRFLPLPDTCKQKLVWSTNAAQSYQAYLWLREQDFDVVHFSEWNSPGYYSLRAKRQGLAFVSTLFCVLTHGPTLWHKRGNAEWVSFCEEIERDHTERASVRLADVLVSPSRYLLRWMNERDWILPERCYVEQYVRPRSVRRKIARPSGGRAKVQELVFFGRLEFRKGLALFCDALDRVAAGSEPVNISITFLGKSAEMDGRKSEDYIAARAARWPWKTRMIVDRDQPGAVAYLQSEGRLAVIASLEDNLPNTVLECLGAAVPFIASSVGGIPEMIAAEDVPACCFDPEPSKLAQKLRQVLREGASVVGDAVDASVTQQAWLRWHESIEDKRNVEVVSQAACAQPKVSVCIVSCDDGPSRERILASVKEQDYRDVEIVFVNVGSIADDHRRLQDAALLRFRERGWSVSCAADAQSPGAARNRTAEIATGDYVLFVDEENLLMPNALSALVAVATRVAADLVTSFVDVYDQNGGPQSDRPATSRLMFLGDCASAGLLRNPFGGGTALMRRDSFLALGGYRDTWGLDGRDHEFEATAVLRGYKLETIPEPLFWRFSDSAKTSADTKASLQRALMQSVEPYLKVVPVELRSVLMYAQGRSFRAVVVPDAQSAETTPFVIAWRSKLEAALAVLPFNQAASAKLLIEGVKAVERCRQPKIVIDAIVTIAPHLAKLDAGRARFLLGLANASAEKLRDGAMIQRIREILSTLPANPSSNNVRLEAGAVARRG